MARKNDDARVRRTRPQQVRQAAFAQTRQVALPGNASVSITLGSCR